MALSLPQVPATVALPGYGPERVSFAPISGALPKLAARSRGKPALRASPSGHGSGWAPGGRCAPTQVHEHFARRRAAFEYGAEGHAAATARAPSAIFREHPIEDLAPGRPEALAFSGSFCRRSRGKGVVADRVGACATTAHRSEAFPVGTPW
jgi:hypothetical protein